MDSSQSSTASTLGSARIEDHVVQAEVAVNQRGSFAGRDVLRQPFDQPIHRVDVFGRRGLVLAAPAIDLPGEVVAGPAIVGETDRGEVDADAARR